MLDDELLGVEASHDLDRLQMLIDVSGDRYPIPLVSIEADLATLLTSQFVPTTTQRVGMTMGFSQSSESVSVVAQGGEGGGAALDQVIGMSVVALMVTAGLLWIGYLHRQRRITWLNNLAEWAGRKFKRPPWVALPMALFIATMICALFGFIWDVSLHIGKGRDPGPLANPAHYFILFGLFLLFIAGCLACVLPLRQARPVRRADHPQLVRARWRHR